MIMKLWKPIGHYVFVSMLAIAMVHAAPATLYVVSNSSEPCPSESCDTLDNYASNATRFFTSDVMVVLLSGEHTLSQSIHLSGLSNFALVRDSTANAATIMCRDGNANLVIHNSTNVTIEGISFFDCGLSGNSDRGGVHFENIVDLRVDSVVVRDCMYHGLRLTNVLGTSLVSNTKVQQTRKRGIPGVEIFYVYQSSNGTRLQPPATNRLTLLDCRLSGDSAALLIDLQASGYSIDMEIDNLVASGLQSDPWPPLRVNTRTSENASVTVRNSNIIDSDTTGLIVFDRGSPQTTIRIDNCNISGHRQSGVLLQFFQSQPTYSTVEIIFENTEITQNAFAITGFGSGVSVFYGGEGQQRPVTFRNVSFSNNTFTAVVQDLPAVVHLSQTENVNFIDCSFIGSLATALRAYRSVFTVAGNIRIEHNVAFRGGAIALFANSYMIVENNTQILFHNNTASHVGGAVYVDNYYIPLLTSSFNCFLRIPALEDTLYSAGALQVTLNFTDNFAENGGTAIYGAQLHTCSLSTFYFFGYQLLTDDLPIVHFIPDAQRDTSLVSSDPERVCICTDGSEAKPDCFSIFLNETRYPGESFTISAAVVGDNFGTVTGSVFARFLPTAGELQPSISNLEATQLVRQQQCTDLQYTVRSGRQLEILTLTATEAPVLQYANKDIVDFAIDIYNSNGRIITDLMASPVFINVTLLPCPVGFVLTEQQECSCDPTLVENDISCNISDQTVRRDGTVWVGASYSGNKSDGIIVYRYCPYGYCKGESLDVNLQYPDTQCARNHAGTLCGSCESGLSLALGTSQCLPCPNGYLALLLLFALAGIVLLVLIRVLNLTVTKGTINGLIFYANIIQASTSNFFPRENASVFIAWLNLDLGIETCFFDGLDAYSKTWLQFVFPVYIWMIALAVILASRYSITVAKICGSNSVPMLATLFHLSYAKLLRTIITSLSFTILDYPHGSARVVWSFDGNIEYLDSKHAPLFAVAVGVLILLWLPYTGILLLSQWLARMPHHRLTRWNARMKPFLDAYFGPFKDKHRYWVGTLLLARCFLFLVFAINPSSTPSVNLLLIVIVTSLLVTYVACTTGLYKDRRKTWLENGFLLNLTLVSAGVLYIHTTDGDGNTIETLAYVSVGIAFGEFLLIIATHLYYVYGHTLWLKIHDCITRKRYLEITEPDGEAAGDTVTAPYTHQSVSLSDLREPMLESLN